MKLSTLSILMGLIVCAPQVFGLMKPRAFKTVVRGFARSTPVGVVLMLIGTGWFVWNVNAEAASDFASYKDKMMMFFAAIGIGTCFFVRDFLAVRGLAVVLLLVAKLMLDTARWEDTEWRLVIVVWAYVFVVVGMWFTVSPWRCRDFLDWGTSSDKMIKYGCVARLAFGLLVVALGLTAFPAAELRTIDQTSVPQLLPFMLAVLP